MNIMDMSPREFSAFLEEERQYRTPDQIDDLMRRYNAANSLSGRLAGLLEPTEGRRRTSILPASVPEGMSLFDAVRSGEAEFAVPQGIVDMIVGGVQGVENPGLAAQGRIPAADMETAALQTAGTAMTGGGLAAGRGVLDYDPTTTRIFAGPKAKTADLDALKKAKELTARRRDPDEIYKQTGWFKGADNQWRFEIPDDKIEFIPDPNRLPEYQLNRAAGLGDVIRHDELFAAYPELRGLLTQTGDNPTPYGGWQPYQDRSSEGFVDIEEEMRAYGPTRRDVESVLVHEIDHAIANREGFSGGTNQSEATSRILEQQNIDLYNLEQRMEARERELGLNQFEYRPDTTDPELLQLRSDYDARVGRSPSNQDIFAMYQRNMGEVAARNTESRRDMTAAERRETSPRLTEDTPREAQWTDGIVTSASSEPLRVYHGGPKKLSASEVEMRPDPEGTPIGFSVTDNPDVAEYYRDMRGGGSISEFDIDLDKANIISEMELYEFIEDLENKIDADASYEQIQRGLLDAGIDAIEYPDPEFGIRVVNPNILAANASPISGLLAQSGVSSEQAQRIEDYLYRTGLLQ